MENTILQRESSDNGKSSVCIAIFQDGKILLTMRRDVPVWVLPGGGIEEGERAEEAAIREAKEETGLLVAIKRKVAIYYPMNKLANLTHFFEGEIIGGNIHKTEETRQVAFFPLQEMPKRIPPPYPDWLKDALLDLPYVLKKKITSVNYGSLLYYLLTHPILVVRFLLTKIGIHINAR